METPSASVPASLPFAAITLRSSGAAPPMTLSSPTTSMPSPSLPKTNDRTLIPSSPTMLPAIVLRSPVTRIPTPSGGPPEAAMTTRPRTMLPSVCSTRPLSAALASMMTVTLAATPGTAFAEPGCE